MKIPCPHCAHWVEDEIIGERLALSRLNLHIADKHDRKPLAIVEPEDNEFEAMLFVGKGRRDLVENVRAWVLEQEAGA